MEFRKLRIIPLMILLVLFFICLSSAQPQLEFQLAPTLELAQIVYVSDFDFYRQGATQFLFPIAIPRPFRKNPSDSVNDSSQPIPSFTF